MPDNPLRDQLQSSLGTAYSLDRELGGGGMSRVFVARDEVLGREIVVKVLPPDTSAALSVERFKREIALAARLQHPHIVPLLGAGETAEGLPYYTMPLVEGESLRTRLAREGELPVGETVGILREIARALAYAHERGIVHRDIKPDNVLLSGGSALVLDFGVAKAVTASATHGDRTTLTQLGTALGTPAYMAPEQAAGDPTVDHRADLYALGCTAYEMLTGQPPFAGRPASALLAAHVTEAPEPVQRRRPNVPPALGELVMQLLEKRPADRPSTATEVLRALDHVAVTPSTMPSVRMSAGASASPSGTFRRAAPWAAGVVLAALAAGAVSWRMAGARAADGAVPHEMRFTVPFPAGWTVTNHGFGAGALDLSPDGSRLLARLARNDTSRVFERRLEDLEWRPLAGADGMSGVAFSLDGRHILLQQAGGRKIFRMPAEGGPLTELVSSTSFSSGALAPDGTLYFTVTYKSGVSSISAPGATPREVTHVDTAWRGLGHWAPQLLPDGKHLLFSSYTTPLDRARIEVVTLATGERTVVVEGGTLARYAGGFLLYLKGDVLVAAPFDPDRLRITSAPQPVLEGVGGSVSSGDANFTVTGSGMLAYVPQSVVAPQMELVWADRTGRMTPILARQAVYNSPRLSPDGTRIAVRIVERGFHNLWVYEPERGIFTAISRRQATTTDPVWAPDGRSLYYAVETPIYDVFRRSADAAAPESLVAATAGDKHPLDVSADGRTLLVRSWLGGYPTGATLSTDGKGELKDLIAGDGEFENGSISPDGRWIVHDFRESGRTEVYLRSYPDVDRVRRQLSAEGGSLPRWSRGGREIVYREGERIMSVAVDPATGAAARPVPLFTATGTAGPFDVTADGSRFVLVRRPSDPAAQAASAPRVVVIANWLQALRGKFDGR